MKVPRILLAAGASGSGKTLITCGILQALINRGVKPCSFKCGPDYIDPMFHSKVIGTKSRNLDTFFADGDILRYILADNSRDCDIAVVEGVMGYYDGLGGISQRASAYDVARTTDTPVVLIVNAKGMSGSAAAFIKGFKEYKEDSNIKGVILNQVSPMLYKTLKGHIEEVCDVKVIGYLPRVTDCLLESRHLGLVMPDEIQNIREKLQALAEIVEETVNLEALIELAESAGDIDAAEPRGGAFDFHTAEPVRIALARDEAFCFMYEDNLRLLQKMGAEIVEFSPVWDAELPEGVSGLILYGGYPELYADEIEKNVSMRSSIREAIEGGLPTLAECGGFMYLHESMEDNEGNAHDGVGVIEGKAFRTPKLNRFGYVTLGENDGAFFSEDVVGEVGLMPVPAHEFHYFDSTSNGDTMTARKPVGGRSWKCMHQTETMLAGFPHLYYYGNPQVAAAFLRKCENYEK